MSHLPEFPSGCGSCGNANKKPQMPQVFEVPTCPDDCATNNDACHSHKGKFYDRLTNNFVLPLAGQEGRMNVCDPTLWSACQWVAICYSSAQGANIAIVRVIDIDKTRSQLRVINACQDGKEIEDNPAPGSTFPEKTVIYPIAPPWCSQTLCDKINAALEKPDCACQGVLKCLKNSTEICFTNVPGLEDGEEAHLFGGLKEPVDESNPSFLKSCLRKLKDIYTGFTGMTLCFPQIPETNNSPDIIDGVPVDKTYAVFDGRGCLRKGPKLAAGGCDAGLNITDDDAEEVGDDDDDHAGNDKILAADAIQVCLEGQGRLLVPDDVNQMLISCKDASNNLFWRVYDRGLMFHPYLSNQPTVVNGSDVVFTPIDGTQVLPQISCNKDVYVVLYVVGLVQPASNNAISYDLIANGFYIHSILTGAGTPIRNSGFGIARADQANLLHVGFNRADAGAGSINTVVSIRGFLV